MDDHERVATDSVTRTSTEAAPRVGVWLVGARGAIAVATMVGVAMLRRGVLPIGLLTESAPYDALPLVGWDALHFGGCDIGGTPLFEAQAGLIADRVLPAESRSVAAAALVEAEAEIANVTQILSVEHAEDCAKLDPIEVIGALRGAIARFRTRKGLDRVVVANVASTERAPDSLGRLADVVAWPDFEEALRRCPSPVPWGVLYAAAAILEGCPFINFTPNVGAELPALEALARRRRVPCAGKDGKTGETLVKSVLAPMFEERRLDVLSWESYNLLGNNDGRVLSDPAVASTKNRSKSRQLGAILSHSPSLHARVTIDYVPSLGDWKTAWNFIHFAGFLGTRMSLQFTWQGSDTMLATPILLDLIRLVELAQRRGEAGDLPYLAAYFKSPHTTNEHDFRRQADALRDHFAGSPTDPVPLSPEPTCGRAVTASRLERSARS
jgi:myo-inositol-1-phosphate synthase